MKKTLILTIVFALSLVFLFAGTPRSYIQKVTLSDGTNPAVTNTGLTTDPNYLITATQVSSNEVISTATHAASQIRISAIGTGVNLFIGTTLQLGAFTAWVPGDVINMFIQHIPTMQTATWSMTIPTGTAAVNIQVPVIIPPAAIVDTWTYNLQVNGPAGTFVVGPAMAYDGTIPYLATDGDNLQPNLLIGTYTAAAAPAGFHWVMNPINVVAGDFTGAKVDHVFNATITFVLEADVPVDTYTLHVAAVGPATMILKNGISTGQVAPWDFVANTAADLIGTYSMDPMGLPAGWHWEPASIDVVAGDFVAAKTATIGLNTMSNGAKVAYAHSINFVQTMDVTYDYPEGVPVQIPGAPAGNIITFTQGNADMIAGFPTAALNPSWNMLFVEYMNLVGPGPWTFTIQTTYPYMWIVGIGVFMGPGTFVINVPAAKDMTLEIQFGNGGDPTLPVELSSFTGVMTAEYFVQLNWVTQSETSLLGYRVLRSEGTEVAGATNMTPQLINAWNESTTHNYSFTDTEVENHTIYNYWLESVEMDGSSQFHGPVSVLVQHEVPPVLPTSTVMRSAYPNPFNVNGNTTIEVEVKEGDNGNVTIYNILGQVVKTYTVNPGNNNLTWNGKDSKGNTCGSGIYFYRLSTPSMNKTMKMVIVK